MNFTACHASWWQLISSYLVPWEDGHLGKEHQRRILSISHSLRLESQDLSMSKYRAENHSSGSFHTLWMLWETLKQRFGAFKNRKLFRPSQGFLRKSSVHKAWNTQQISKLVGVRSGIIGKPCEKATLEGLFWLLAKLVVFERKKWTPWQRFLEMMICLPLFHSQGEKFWTGAGKQGPNGEIMFSCHLATCTHLPKAANTRGFNCDPSSFHSEYPASKLDSKLTTKSASKQHAKSREYTST